MKPVISDEALNAFVDGEYDLAESESLIARMREDSELAQRVCALRSLQSMVRLAYAKPPTASNQSQPGRQRKALMQRCAFGCLILLAGLSGGWALRSLESPAVASSVAPSLPGGYQAVSLARAADPSRVLLHIDSASPEKMLAVLDEAERQSRSMQIEVIANSHGLDLLRAGVSPYSDRIEQMRKRHAGLQFVACGQSITRFRREGQAVVLLPRTHATPSAIGEIVTRLQQGWTYVRV
jgi:intracellular sulfur oxidation DsrE/DsrF family protein